MNQPKTLIADNIENYRILDSGDGEKLEYISGYKIIRPDSRIIWPKSNPKQWLNIDAKFIRTSSKEGKWIVYNKTPNPWIFNHHGIKLLLKPTEFKHIGVFPEQTLNWDWISGPINNQQLSILNLFAYTGGATLASALKGRRVTHVDSLKSAVNWASENAKISEIGNNNIRWIVDDASKFVEREIKRGSKYDGIILDPPKFGRGINGEVFKVENDLPKLLNQLKKIKSDNFFQFLLNVYTADISPFALKNLIDGFLDTERGETEFGELTIKESVSNRLIPHGIYVRWNRSN